MPNIVYLWDFEDGTTQGWTLGSNTSLDGNGKVQGIYSLKFSYSYYKYGGTSTIAINERVAYIEGVDLSSVQKPMLVLILRDESIDYPSYDYYANNPGNIAVVVKEGVTGEVIASVELCMATGKNFTRVLVFDISAASGHSNVTIEIYERGNLRSGGGTTVHRIHYLDQIAIIDGADVEYVVAKLVGSEESIDMDIDVSEGVSGLTATKVGLAAAGDVSTLASAWSFSMTVLNGDNAQETISFSNSYEAGYGEPTNGVNSVVSMSVSLKLQSISGFLGSAQRFVAVLLDDSWEYKKIYCVTLVLNINAVERFTAVYTTTYGSSVTDSREVSLSLGGSSSFDVAVQVDYLVGDPAVTTGSLVMEVWSSDMSTKHGESAVDLSGGTSLRGSFVTGLGSGSYKLRFTWSIQSQGRVVLRVSVVVRASG